MGKRSTATGSAPVTRSKKAHVNEDAPSDPRPSSPTKKASSLERRKNVLPSKGTTPVWIQYYDREAKDPNSCYGRGFQQPDDFYEKQMEACVGSTDRFYDTLQQNPEACIVIYADGNRNMEVLHHLTASNHGKPIIVGLDGFGSMSEVKAIHEELIVNQVLLNEKEERTVVPDLDDFLSNQIDDIETKNKVDPGDGASEFTVLGQVFASQPQGYLIHPEWLNFIYTTIGRKPEIMGKALLDGVRRSSTDNDSLGEKLDAVYPFLIFLWACHQEFIGVGHRTTTYSIDMSKFENIQSQIAEKTFRLTKKGGHPKIEHPHPPRQSSSSEKSVSPSADRVVDRWEDRAITRGRNRSRSTRSSRGRRSRSRERQREDHHQRRRSQSRSRSRSRSSRRRRSSSYNRRKDDSRSRSRDREIRHRSRSPLIRYSSDSYKKRKTLADKLTDEQMRAFVLLSARDWRDERPELNRKMEKVLGQSNLSAAVAMIRSEINHGDWKGTRF